MMRVAYTIVGEVAIISVKNEDELEAPETIRKAKEVLRRHPRLRAVYAKLETSGEYRVQKLVLILGEDVKVTWHRENGIDFRVSLGRVYYNPRLSTEHRLIAEIARSEGAKYVLDAFSGIGGYTLHIAVFSKPELIVANDLNPFAIADLVASLYRNRRKTHSQIIILNMDSRALQEVLDAVFDFIILDLPHESIHFINSLCKLGAPSYTLIVYRVGGEDAESVLKEVLNSIDDRICGQCKPITTRRVIDYAPRRYVYRVHLRCSKRI